VTKAVFLDRDGVINKKPPEGDYVTCWDDFKFLPRVDEAIAQLNRAGFYVIVVTNQRCIAKGLMTVAQLETIHKRMSESLAERGARIDAIYYCPHEMKPICRCRKPAPGMFVDAARDYRIELPASWMIGDSDIDIEAGKNAGCKTARLLDETGEDADADQPARNSGGLVANSLLEAVSQILHYEKRIGGQEIVVSTSSAHHVERVASHSKNNKANL
jgi:D-glycero-D-manno-heptose 1,7-bisphosphate phosphatase